MRANKSLKKCDVQDSSVVPYLLFKYELRPKAQDLFYWRNNTINTLISRKLVRYKPLSEKHRLACYFFESAAQAFLSPLDNVLDLPGYKCFYLN